MIDLDMVPTVRMRARGSDTIRCSSSSERRRGKFVFGLLLVIIGSLAKSERST